MNRGWDLIVICLRGTGQGDGEGGREKQERQQTATHTLGNPTG